MPKKPFYFKSFMIKSISIFVVMCIFFTAHDPAYAVLKRHKVLPKHLKKLESKLLAQTKRAEELLYKSGAIYEDPDVVNYIDKIGNELVPPDFKDENVEFNFKIIRDPMVNAFALPNGSIYVHTGVLARLENEAQLAFLLGHEISHVVNKDSVYFTDSLHNKTVTTKLIDVVLGPASVFFGLLADIVSTGFGLLYASTVTGYSREQEARADLDAIKNGLRRGYDLGQAPRIIEILMAEHDKYQRGDEIYFLMLHPSNKIRLKKIKKRLEKEYSDEQGGKKEVERFFEQMAKVKNYNASLNIKMDRLEHAMDNIRSILTVRPKDAEAHFYAGEIYRLKYEDPKRLKYELDSKGWRKVQKAVKKEGRKETWRKKAFEEYESALAYKPDYPDAFRGLGLLCLGIEEKERALEHLTKYLQLNPAARDKRYIKKLIERIKKDEGS